jgi:hypothetical protein
MLFEWILGGMIIAGVGSGTHFAVQRWFPDYELTWKEFGFIMAFFLAIGLFCIIKLFDYVAITNLITYHENWSGYETAATLYKTTCTEDGICVHCYDCHPYWVDEDYECGTDKHPKTCTRQVKKYHQCPYTTEEWTFTVDASTGDSVTMSSHGFPTNPDQHRWRGWQDTYSWLPSLPSYVYSGVPPEWQAASDRIAANQPGPVVFRHNYHNYILAADHTVLKQYSPDIDRFKQQGLLPVLNNGQTEFYIGNRVYFVGARPDGDWQTASNYFNAAFGLERQGDLQLVIVDANKVSSSQADDYTGALVAYWQGPDFQKDTLSKNGVVVVLGTSDNKTVAWARAATGMPEGNELLLVNLRDQLQGKSLDPATIFGHPAATLVSDGEKVQVKVTHSQGALESVLFGSSGFQRVHMADYQHLKHEIQPTDEQKVWLYVSIFLVSLFSFGLTARLGPRTFHRLRR